MNLKGILALTNQVEKAKFINIIDRMCTETKGKNDALAECVRKISGQIKHAETDDITELFSLVSVNFETHAKRELALLGAQATLLTNILSRDGNCIARISWVETLYEREWEMIDSQSKVIDEMIREVDPTSDDFTEARKLDLYHSCLKEAHLNDERINREAKISDDERGILNLLARKLDIGADEQAAIEHLVDKIPKNGVQEALNSLREIGLLFISRKDQVVYVPNEIVSLLNRLQGKKVATKHYLRILRTMSDPELSNILKVHNRRIRGVERKDKIDSIMKMGVPLNQLLINDLHNSDSTVSDRKDRLKQLINDLNLDLDKLGTTIEERIELVVDALNTSARKEFSTLSASGYGELFSQLQENYKDLPNVIKSEFEIEENQELDVDKLSALNITPHDLLYMLPNDEIKKIADNMKAKKRGNLRQNIIDAFANANDKLIENYNALAKRDLSSLKCKDIEISEADIGVKFEEVTRSIFEQLGMTVDEELRRNINTVKDKADILISLSEDDVIICEAKTCKNGDFSKYSTTSRQVKAYVSRTEKAGKRVAQVLIVAPSFSDDFVEAAEMDTEVNISLLEASGLKEILDAYKSRRNPNFSAKLFTKGGLLKSSLIAKNI